MRPTRQRTATLALGSIALTGALAGCSGSPDDSAPDRPSEAAEPSASSSAPSPESSPSEQAEADSVYRDGDYSATGEYQSPGGTESVDVQVTLEGDVLTAVVVEGNSTQPGVVRYQTAFSEGIAAEVVGTRIDELQVDKVAGSSLTSGGFNEALEQIKAEAIA